MRLSRNETRQTDILARYSKEFSTDSMKNEDKIENSSCLPSPDLNQAYETKIQSLTTAKYISWQNKSP